MSTPTSEELARSAYQKNPRLREIPVEAHNGIGIDIQVVHWEDLPQHDRNVLVDAQRNTGTPTEKLVEAIIRKTWETSLTCYAPLSRLTISQMAHSIVYAIARGKASRIADNETDKLVAEYIKP